MPSDSSLFSDAIAQHLELKRRNQHLESVMPLDEFLDDDPFSNHPLFKSEADARREEEETGEQPAIALDGHADTAELPAVQAHSESPEEPRGWMDTPQASDFTWE
jgi:hypothetical protein